MNYSSFDKSILICVDYLVLAINFNVFYTNGGGVSMRFTNKCILFVFFVSFVLEAVPVHDALAQTGKLAGLVTDTNTGEPIPGATVVIDETGQGTATDFQGRYVILNISPGTYTIRISFVGFTTKVFDGVLVTSDRTTTLDATIEQTTVQAGEVVVEAVRPVVDANQTTSRSLITNEEIQLQPVASLDEVISKTSNSYDGYIRGSRRFETRTVVEGIDISDAYYAVSGVANGYGGDVYHNTNKADRYNPSIFQIVPEGIQEVAVNSGATEAQYSSGTGGVVTVSLAETRGRLQGSFSARVAPQINRPGPDSLDFYFDSDAYMEEAANVALLANGGDEVAAQRAQLYSWTPDTYSANEDPEIDIRASLGGSITNKWHFFFTGQWFETNGFLPNEFTKRLSGQLKTTYEFTPRTSVTAVGMIEDRGLWGEWNNRDYREVFRFNLESVAQNDGGSYLGSLKLTHVINDNSYIQAQAYRTFIRERYGYPDDDGDGFTEPGEDGDFIDLTDPANIEKYIGVNGDHSKMFEDRISDSFSDTGLLTTTGLRYRLRAPVPYSEDAIQTLNGFKIDYANQVTFNHFIQLGTELKLREIDYDEVYGVDGIGFTLNRENEPYIPRDWVRNPWSLAFYASDRMEFGGLIINLGARLEVVDRDMEEITDFFFPLVRDTVVVEGRELARNFFRRGDKVSADVFFSPSIGVSHPIGTNAAMYFSYARQQQLPPFHQLYQLYDGNHSTSRFFSYQDPEQDPITSNNFELGIQWEFSPGWGADVNAYMRSIDNFGQTGFIATNRVPEDEAALPGHSQYTFRTSFGYGDSQGIELVLRRAPLQLSDEFTLGVTASYTFATIEQALQAGVNQNSFNSEGDSDIDLPLENAEEFSHFPWNVRGGSSALTNGFDRRHRGVIRVSSSLPADISLGITGSIESGFLYEPVIDVDERDRALLTGPANSQFDLRLQKRFNFTNRIGLDVYLDVTNIFDKDNILFYDRAGTNPNGPEIFQEEGVPGRRLVNIDGTVLYGPSRNVYFGTRLNF